MVLREVLALPAASVVVRTRRLGRLAWEIYQNHATEQSTRTTAMFANMENG